jgi:hypothetical protein
MEKNADSLGVTAKLQLVNIAANNAATLQRARRNVIAVIRIVISHQQEQRSFGT